MSQQYPQNSFNDSVANGALYQTYVNIVGILYEQGVRQVVMSPGSRSAPLAITLMRHGKFECHVLVDERSAAFTALGMAQASGQPVVLVCTSGTAAMNYGPAMAEAYFQQIPLIAITADRPPEWVNQGENQIIFQEGIFGKNLKGSFSLPADFVHPDARKAAYRKVNEAVHCSLYPEYGPVHLNAPFREPIYPKNSLPEPDSPLPVIYYQVPYPKIANHFEELKASINKADRILILAGMLPRDPYLRFLVEKWIEATNAVLINDVTGNLHEAVGVITQGDRIFAKAWQDKSDWLQPDLLITVGSHFVSKSLKSYLRHYSPNTHWHIDRAGHEHDLFQCLTRVIPIAPKHFFEQTLPWVGENQGVTCYQKAFESIAEKMEQMGDGEKEGKGLSEIATVEALLSHIPENGILQLGNSQPVRHVSRIGLESLMAQGVKIYSNRGTSGIDGCVSTAVGYALNTENQVVLLSGDLTFMYDRNGLWNPELPGNLTIVILNNQGGGIFRTIEGPSQAELETYFASRQNLNFEPVAQQHGCGYQRVQTHEELKQAFAVFDQEERNFPVIIEVVCGE